VKLIRDMGIRLTPPEGVSFTSSHLDGLIGVNHKPWIIPTESHDFIIFDDFEFLTNLSNSNAHSL
jgi:hypothetical protein